MFSGGMLTIPFHVEDQFLSRPRELPVKAVSSHDSYKYFFLNCADCVLRHSLVVSASLFDLNNGKLKENHASNTASRSCKAKRSFTFHSFCS